MWSRRGRPPASPGRRGVALETRRVRAASPWRRPDGARRPAAIMPHRSASGLGRLSSARTLGCWSRFSGSRPVQRGLSADRCVGGRRGLPGPAVHAGPALVARQTRRREAGPRSWRPRPGFARPHLGADQRWRGEAPVDTACDGAAGGPRLTERGTAARCRANRQAAERPLPSSVTVIRNADGRCYASFVVEVAETPLALTTEAYALRRRWRGRPPPRRRR